VQIHPKPFSIPAKQKPDAKSIYAQPALLSLRGFALAKNKIIIIGAGIGGLSAGCYAQMSGFDSQIFEMHNMPGGQCTAWKRGGYIFDGCIHHLAGCKPGYLLESMWKELGALPARRIIYPQDMCQVEDETGKRFTVYVNLEQLKQEMHKLAPQDASAINNYIKAAEIFTNLDMLDMPLLDTAGFAGRFIKMATIMKYGLPMSKFTEKFQDPYMRKVFPTIQYDWTETPLFVHLNMIGNCHSQNYGVPEGGSLEFAKAIEQRYRKLGGTTNYNAKVQKILVENDTAVGVRLTDGSEHRADTIISDAFTHTTIFELLDGRYVDENVNKMFAKPKDEVEMGIHVSLGVNRDLSKEPRALVLFLEKPTKIADKERTKLDLELFGYDPSVAPTGKSIIKVLLSTTYSFWNELRRDPKRYNAQKQEIAQTVLKLLEKRFPDVTDQVEVTDVATPLTTERFTGINATYDISWGFTGALNFMRGQPRTLPKLKGFFLAGGQAGLPGCAAQARNIIRKICQQQNRKFQHTQN
jgi:phytoene dehydrogenase-like protein